MGKKASDGYYVRRREFLNEDPDLPAYIIAIAEDTRAIPDDDPAQSWNNGELTLDLSDCHRRISFYFYMHNPRERANSLRKITLITEMVNKMHHAILLEVASRNARPDRVTPAPVQQAKGEHASQVINVLQTTTEEPVRG